ncbi:AraC family transcriptional regulator [Pseudenhygromyxa sp. WMMC2535]|uniref:AraC family transcriptional regulator n=1 Tax=Pseudenhygromyxa sp. WMMC2535 TaxID=2712867 RepID=UPI0015569855|nr:helix-turn-helix domain-containing protein [Pseudenhygromyxa sp. WMMC2535]NVB38267.1 AraC family transcriptional regulator [Pseudenhygromyxa sp. WMMC2535]
MRIERRGDHIWIRGAIVDNRPHAHDALQLVASAAAGPEAQLQLEHGREHGRLFVIPSRERHALALHDGVVALVNPSSPLAATLRRRWLTTEGAARVCAPPLTASDDPCERLSEMLATVEQTPHDPRVRRVLQWVDELERRGCWRELTLTRAAQQVALSPSRLRHLFKAEVGSPWRSYLVWRRALAALTLAAQGTPLTSAAHATGYADSAQLSRQFAQLFGLTPSTVLRRANFTQ